jgi:hypothetical protein
MQPAVARTSLTREYVWIDRCDVCLFSSVCLSVCLFVCNVCASVCPLVMLSGNVYVCSLQAAIMCASVVSLVMLSI